jgi:hypothetical protein
VKTKLYNIFFDIKEFLLTIICVIFYVIGFIIFCPVFFIMFIIYKIKLKYDKENKLQKNLSFIDFVFEGLEIL